MGAPWVVNLFAVVVKGCVPKLRAGERKPLTAVAKRIQISFGCSASRAGRPHHAPPASPARDQFGDLDSEPPRSGDRGGSPHRADGAREGSWAVRSVRPQLFAEAVTAYRCPLHRHHFVYAVIPAMTQTVRAATVTEPDTVEPRHSPLTAPLRTAGLF